MSLMNKLDRFCITALVFGTLILATTVKGMSITFDAYAIDNCDSTSSCQNNNLGGSSQNNNCNLFTFCDNVGTSNIQNNNCAVSSACTSGSKSKYSK